MASPDIQRPPAQKIPPESNFHHKEIPLIFLGRYRGIQQARKKEEGKGRLKKDGLYLQHVFGAQSVTIM